MLTPDVVAAELSPTETAFAVAAATWALRPTQTLFEPVVNAVPHESPTNTFFAPDVMAVPELLPTATLSTAAAPKEGLFMHLYPTATFRLAPVTTLPHL